MTRVIAISAVALILVAIPAFAQDDNKLLQCQAQLAETTWSYEALHKDRQEKERLRDKSEVRAYILDREVQRLRQQIAEMKKAVVTPAAPAPAEPEKKE